MLMSDHWTLLSYNNVDVDEQTYTGNLVRGRRSIICAWKQTYMIAVLILFLLLLLSVLSTGPLSPRLLHKAAASWAL